MKLSLTRLPRLPFLRLSRAQPVPASGQPRGLSESWQAFLRNPSGLAGLFILLAIVAIAAFANVLFPGDPLDMVAEPLLWPFTSCLLYTSPSPRDLSTSRMPSSA